MTCTNEKCGRQYVGKSEEELRQRHYGHKKEIDLKSTMLGKHFAEKCGYGFFQIQASSGLSDTLKLYVMNLIYQFYKHKIITRQIVSGHRIYNLMNILPKILSLDKLINQQTDPIMSH